MCIFESAIVKSDYPMQENYKICKDYITDCWFTLPPPPSTQYLKKNPVNQLMKKFWPKVRVLPLA